MSRQKQQNPERQLKLFAPVETLLLALSSPRERAKGTIDSYLLTAKNYFLFAGNDNIPGEEGLRKYFLQRRREEIKERTLRKEFVHLKKLYLSNHWDWPFTRDDMPQPKEAATAPAFTLEEITTLIRAYHFPRLVEGTYLKYSNTESFYLAVSTTWGPRREEILNIKRRDYDPEVITIRLAKRRTGEKLIRHIIPEEIKPILFNYHPRLKTAASLSYAFQAILLKSGLGEKEGYGFHAVRRSLRTLLEWNLAKDGLPLSLVADFMGWSPSAKGVVYGGAAMLGVYSHPEILSSDPLGIDKLVLEHHPFVSLWQQ